jgi:hypothetical protein
MPLLRRIFTALSLSTLALAASGSPLQAQGPSRIISINPFLPLAGSFQGEFETRVRDNMSVAVSASHLDFGDEDNRYTNADIKLRLYPSERALEGFGIAAGLGIGRLSNVETTQCFGFPAERCDYQRRSTTGPAFSVEMQYQWLLGRNRNTAVTAGGGAKRYYIDDSPNGYDVFSEYVPTLRLTIGYAFR